MSSEGLVKPAQMCNLFRAIARAKSTHSQNDSQPKRPTKKGWIDSSQNLAEMTHGRNDLGSAALDLQEVVQLKFPLYTCLIYMFFLHAKAILLNSRLGFEKK